MVRSLHDRPTVSMVWIRLLCNIIISIKFTCLVNPSHEVTCTVILPLKKYVRIICLTWISIGGPLGSLKPQFLSLKKRSQRIKEWQNLIWTDSGRLKFNEKMARKFFGCIELTFSTFFLLEEHLLAIYLSSLSVQTNVSKRSTLITIFKVELMCTSSFVK